MSWRSGIIQYITENGLEDQWSWKSRIYIVHNRKWSWRSGIILYITENVLEVQGILLLHYINENGFEAQGIILYITENGL